MAGEDIPVTHTGKSVCVNGEQKGYNFEVVLSLNYGLGTKLAAKDVNMSIIVTCMVKTNLIIARAA